MAFILDNISPVKCVGLSTVIIFRIVVAMLIHNSYVGT